MTMLDDPDRIELENGVRTMLRTLATEVHADPPAWDELIARPAPVLRLPTAGRQVADPASRPRWHHRPRTSVAAAAVVALAVGGALLVDRGTGDGATDLPAETITAISPGDPAFEAEAAAAVWTTDLPDPVSAAAAYLAANGIPATPPIPGSSPIPGPPPLPDAPSIPSAPAALQLIETDGPTATVEWSLAADSGGSGGTIYLRASEGRAGVEGWTVVGAAASDVALEGVRYDGERLEFTVSRTAAGDAPLAVGIWVDGQPVPLGGEAVPHPGDALVSLGELVDIGPDAGAERELGLAVDADGTVTLRVEQLVDGHVRSLTQMVVLLPDADSSTATEIAAAAGMLAAEATSTADAAASGAGSVDASADGAGSVGADASADGEAGVTLPGADIPVPDASDLTVPEDVEVPSLPPLLPEVPLPAPPTAPSTLPAPLGDVLP